ncbi:MAG: site-2 protease family protein [Candidatus Nealsonbacteria bacterium]|nr:site-2 protease family protein [Candidatus Nealsonbacteria bacterium]
MPIIALIAFFSLIALVILHELGHFLLAKRFGVKVEEFGIGLPPRIFGKKAGETVYSLNLLPFGAFVRMFGEEEEKQDPRSFSSKPIWQRALIVFGGVAVFWIAAAVLFSVIIWSGAPTAVDDSMGGVQNTAVQVADVANGSPAQKSGLKIGDKITELKINGSILKTDKVKEVQEFIDENKGKEVVLLVERGGEDLFEVALVPRVSPPGGEGAMGVALIRTAVIKYPWYEVPLRGVFTAANLTLGIIMGWAAVLGNITQGKGVGAQLMGPVGILNLFGQVGQLGWFYFLNLVAVISVYLAIFNVLPIPALDGGKLLFLAFEKIKGMPLSQKTEQKITQFFFILLVALLAFVTVKDIIRIL